MGLFALSTGETAREMTEAAIANLQLFLDDCKANENAKSVSYCSQPYPGDYLISFAQSYVKQALEAYKKECDANPLLNPDNKKLKAQDK